MELGTVFAVTAVAVIASLATVFLRDSRLPVLALVAVLAASAVILLRLFPIFQTLWKDLSQIGGELGADSGYLELLLKIIALAYVAEFGAQFCRDAGQGGTALKVELAAKLCVIVLALPIFGAVTSSVLSLLP